MDQTPQGESSFLHFTPEHGYPMASPGADPRRRSSVFVHSGTGHPLEEPSALPGLPLRQGTQCTPLLWIRGGDACKEDGRFRVTPGFSWCFNSID